MYITIDKLLSRIPEKARVLDLGGWHRVFPRANVVVDLGDYESRNNYYPDIPERFTKDDWIIADFCSPEFWSTIKDKEFDFVTIGHTLEDIRDPLYVCAQMIRCCKAGYFEAPSKMRECAKESATATHTGYEHHRWIMEPSDDRSSVVFKAKLAWAHNQDYLGDERRHLLHDYHWAFTGYFWEGSFGYYELMPKGGLLETEDLRWYFKHKVRLNEMPPYLVDLLPNSTSGQDGKCIWVNDYLLDSEKAG